LKIETAVSSNTATLVHFLSHWIIRNYASNKKTIALEECLRDIILPITLS